MRRIVVIMMFCVLSVPLYAGAADATAARALLPAEEATTTVDTGARATTSPEEMLLFSDEERISIATKHETTLSEAPANVAVISHDEIARSPELSIPEIIRRVAGMDVVTVTAAESDLSAHGFVRTASDSDRVAVLIDGRDAGLASLGTTIFSSLPVSRYDIKRIEIIKGPMSSLHGDRAFLGTINIVTFNPEETHTVLAGGGGMFKDGRGDVINAGKFTDGLWYKLSADYERADSLDAPAGIGRTKDLETIGATGMIDWRPDDRTQVRLTSGFSNSDLALQIAGITPWSLRDGFVMGDARHDFGLPGELSTKIWWRRYKFSTDDPFAQELPQGTFDNVSAEVHDTIDIQANDWFRNVTTAGFEYRLLTTGSVANADDLHTLAGYLQSQFRFWEKLLITGGYRLDYQKGFAGANNSFHGSIVWKAHPKYTAKLGMSHAFNTPTFTNFFLNAPATAFGGFTVSAMGNRALESENILYFEFMNEIRPLEWMTVTADFFYYRMKDLIVPQVTLSTPTTAAVTFANQGGAEAFGGEAGIEARPVKGLTLYTNWAYEHMRPVLGSTYTTENLGNPKNKVNAGVRYASDFGLFANVDFSWVQAHQAQAGAFFNFDTTPSVNIGDSYLLSARLGYQPLKDRLELAVIANNILNDNTPQIPQMDPVLNVRMAERPAFRLLGTISYTF